MLRNFVIILQLSPIITIISFRFFIITCHENSICITVLLVWFLFLSGNDIIRTEILQNLRKTIRELFSRTILDLIFYSPVDIVFSLSSPEVYRNRDKNVEKRKYLRNICYFHKKWDYNSGPRAHDPRFFLLFFVTLKCNFLLIVFLMYFFFFFCLGFNVSFY